MNNQDLDYSIDNYMTLINMKCEKDGCKKREYIENDDNNKKGKKSNKKTEKIDDDKPYIPKMNEYEMIYKNNYNVQQLKYFAKSYKLKIGGNKKTSKVSSLFQNLAVPFGLSYHKKKKYTLEYIE